MTAVQEKAAKNATKKLDGKIAVVTGGSRGIGAAIAQRLAAEGAHVAITYNNSKESADKVVAEITKSGGKALAVKANVTSTSESDALIAEIKKLGKIDILVNNAGVFQGGPIDNVGIEVYDHVFETNVRGVVATTMAALRNFNDGGRIINVSSVAARAHMQGFSFYAATKAALDALTRVWAQDLGARRITVNGVAPGTTLTDMLQAGLDKDTQQLYISKTALGRLGEPSDIADVVAFLASDDARWVTGQTIETAGGLAA